MSPIEEIDWDGERCTVASPRGEQRKLEFVDSPDSVGLSSFDASELAPRWERADSKQAQHLRDGTGFASAVFAYDLHVPPAQTARVAILAPLAPGGTSPPELLSLERLDRSDEHGGPGVVGAARIASAIRVPPSAQPMIDTLRTSLAYILMSRDGPVLRPGSRSYARSWIRDGALTSAALLRLGQPSGARATSTGSRRYQFANGKVPCCVDARGADPVPENDSHGELIFLATRLYRYTGDRAAARARLAARRAPRRDTWMRCARSERTAANRGRSERAYYGLLPPSISHEGYSAKPDALVLGRLLGA